MKKLLSFLLMGVFLLTFTSMFVSCGDDYDDSSLRELISTNATDLNSLVDEKVSNVQHEIDALKQQQSALDDAYKLADKALQDAIDAASNDAKGYADIQAAEAQRAAIAAAQTLVDDAVAKLQQSLSDVNAALSSHGKSIEGLLAADAALQTGINEAKASASAAYTLAEKAGEAAEKVAKDLKTINETLSSQINVLGEQVSAVQETAAKNAANIAAQEKALDDLKDANDKVLKQLNAKDDELKSLIEANQTEIDKLQKSVAEAKAAAEKALADAKSYVNQEVGKINSDIDTKLKAVESAYAEADEALQSQISALQETVRKHETAISVINENIAKVNTLLASLINGNVNNLITSIIYQGRYSWNNVYAKVVNTGNVVFKPNTNNGYVVFPYVGATGVQELKVGTYNVQEYAGYLYATINPADIDATKSTISLENSLGSKSAYYTLDTPHAKAATGVALTRASSPNGLWSIPVLSIWDKTKNPATNVDEKLYALTTSYPAYIVENGEKKEVIKKLYSHYAIDIQPVLTSPVSVITLEGAGETLDNAPAAGVDIQFSDIEGKLTMGTNNKPVYKKYIECISVKNSQNTEVSGAVAQFNSANAQFRKVLDAENEGKADLIDVVCPEKYSNYKITIRYYAWNYDGTIVSIDKVVVFNKLLWNTENASVTITPASSEVQTAFSSEFPTFNFVKGINGLNQTKWSQEAYYVTATVKGASNVLATADGKVTFFRSNKQTVCTQVNVSTSTSTKTQLSDIANIKEMRFSYDPQYVKPGNYEVTVSFYDKNNFKVNIVNLAVIIKEPVGKPDPWHIPAAFDPSDKLTIGWATPYPNEHPNHEMQTGAKYAFSGSFYNVMRDFDGLGSYYIFKDNNTYGTLTGQIATKYRPFAYAQRADYAMVVPNEALSPAEGGEGSEHSYSLTAGIRFYGLDVLDSYSSEAKASSNCWSDLFTIKFMSPIRYAILGTKSFIDGKTYEGMTVKPITVQYRQSVTIGNDYFSAIDPKEAVNTAVLFFENYDERIADVQVEPANKLDGNLALFTDIKKNNDGTFTFITSDKVSMTSSPTVYFNLIVKDVWGCVTKKQFGIKVVANQ